MVKEVKELIEIVGKGNLLETLFIYWGTFQHANLERSIDFRNHLGLSSFIRKIEEPLDKYFNLMFSLQGLFLIYVQTYKSLQKNNQLNTQGVIDKIYEAVNSSELGKQLSGVIDREQLIEEQSLQENNQLDTQEVINKIEKQRKLKLLSLLVNPKGGTLFESNDDFEKQVINSVKELLMVEYTNIFDKDFAINEHVISWYYSIHRSIKVSRDVTLLFSMGDDYRRLSPSNQEKSRLVMLDKITAVIMYIGRLTSALQRINIPHRNGFTRYVLSHSDMDHLEQTSKVSVSYALADNKDNPRNAKCYLYPKNIKKITKKLLREQNSGEFENKFEARITDLKNIYYISPQIAKKEARYKNTACKLILGAFVASVALSVIDCYFMEQKSLKLLKNVLPQDNFTNLVITTVLAVVVVFAAFQLLKQPPENKMDEVNISSNGNLSYKS